MKDNSEVLRLLEEIKKITNDDQMTNYINNLKI